MADTSDGYPFQRRYVSRSRGFDPTFGPPSNFGMSRQGVAAERARLRRMGWQPWEIDVRLLRPEDVSEDPTGADAQ